VTASALSQRPAKNFIIGALSPLPAQLSPMPTTVDRFFDGKNSTFDAYNSHQKKASEIGNAILNLQSNEKLLVLQEKRLEQAQYYISYQQAQGYESLDPMELAKAMYGEKRIIADMAKTKASIDSQFITVKVQLGLDPEQRLQIDPTSLSAMLASDRALSAVAKNSWEAEWRRSPEAKIYKIALDLHDYDILASWAGYLPGIAWDVYTANPKSAYSTYTGDEDIFLAINFTIPLLDW
jgi:hypothetical protein